MNQRFKLPNKLMLMPDINVLSKLIAPSGNGSGAVLVKEHYLINKKIYVATQGKFLKREAS